MIDEDEKSLKIKQMICDSLEGKFPKFYCFRQNNSGGSFDDDDNVCVVVFIEAMTAAEANEKATEIGIYFNGVENGSDCECCGDRWSETYEMGAIDKPMLYGRDVRTMYKDGFNDKCIIYRLNGEKEKIIFPTEKDCPGHIFIRQSYIGKKCKICNKWDESKDE
jgi:hypothetical protein